MPMEVPQEILESIIYELANDLPTLGCCSLTAQRFRVISQSLIFSEVSLLPSVGVQGARGKATQNSRSSRFYDLLQASPHIAAYVRCLVIMEGSLFTTLRPNRGGGAQVINRQLWVAKDATLPLVIGSLPWLSSFSLLFQDGPMRLWCSLSTALRSSLKRAFCLPTMRHVELQNISFRHPMELGSLYEGCTGLKHISFLSIRGTDIIPFPMAHEIGEYRDVDVEKRAKIETLTITTLERNRPPLLSWLFGSRSSLDLTNLQKLSLPATGMLELCKVLRIIEKATTALREITLAEDLCLPYGVQEALDPDISAFTKLKLLTVGIVVFYTPDECEDSTVRWLARLLSTIRSNCEVHISAFIEKASFFRRRDWETVNTALTSCFSRNVTFNICAVSTREQEMLLDMFNESVPHLCVKISRKTL